VHVPRPDAPKRAALPQICSAAANGDILLATVPMNDDGTAPNGGLAIFYGSSTAPIAQRPITGFEQSQSGTGTLTFLGDGETSWTLSSATSAPRTPLRRIERCLSVIDT
jgi:hypothetical protein